MIIIIIIGKSFSAINAVLVLVVFNLIQTMEAKDGVGLLLMLRVDVQIARPTPVARLGMMINFEREWMRRHAPKTLNRNQSKQASKFCPRSRQSLTLAVI